MKITKIDIPKTENPNDGLEPIKMDKLGKLVLIAGQNGSGKTRILNKIFGTLDKKPGISSLPTQERINALRDNIDSYNNEIDKLKISLNIIEKSLKSNVTSQIHQYEKSILSFT